MWRVFDTTIHRPCKCLQYSWSTNSATILDMCWQFVILNVLHRLVLRKWEGSLFNYLSIYLFRSPDSLSKTDSVRQFVFFFLAVRKKYRRAFFKKLWVAHTGDLHGCPCAFFISLYQYILNCYSSCVPEYEINNIRILLNFAAGFIFYSVHI